MSLDIIGAGFGRTGTLSLKLALEELGYKKTYHMMELFQNPDHLRLWKAGVAGETVDWDTLFNGYRAAVDWPASAYWHPLSEHYPDARIILSVRDPDKWFDSVHNTIYPSSMKERESDDAHTRSWANWACELIWEGVFGGRIDDRDHAKSVYQANIEQVQKIIPRSRLLVFEASQGWQPLCDFLNCEVPDTPYPRVNTTEDFKAR